MAERVGWRWRMVEVENTTSPHEEAVEKSCVFGLHPPPPRRRRFEELERGFEIGRPVGQCRRGRGEKIPPPTNSAGSSM